MSEKRLISFFIAYGALGLVIPFMTGIFLSDVWPKSHSVKTVGELPIGLLLSAIVTGIAMSVVARLAGCKRESAPAGYLACVVTLLVAIGISELFLS